MESKICSFCGAKIELGTGKMYVRRDGSVLYFDSSKCEKNSLKLKREPRRVRWTESGRQEKAKRIKFSKDATPKRDAVKAPSKKEGEGSEVSEPIKES